MKKLLLCACATLVSMHAASAQETVKKLYQGSQAVTWENTLSIDADMFAEGVSTGDYISIALADATDVLEIKADGSWLPGSILSNIDGRTEYRAYITEGMLDALRLHGLEICGKSFTVTSVDVMNDGFAMPDGAIWGGYFWIDNWNTLELFKTAFNSYSGEEYLDIYMEASDNSYVLNILTAWDNPDALWTNGQNTVKTPSKATVDLKGINVREALADVNALMFQLNPEGGSPFNITAIALRAGGQSSVADIAADQTSTTVYSLQGIAVRTDVNVGNALENLPAGIYIMNGRKHAVR